MNEKKRRVIIIISVIATLVVAFLIYWKATEHDRYIKGCIDDVREEILDYRSGASSDIYFWVSSSAMEDPTYIDFLSTQVSEMIDNAEYNLLYKFLKRLELEDAYISGIKNDVTNLFNSVGDLKAALEIKDKLEYLDYYNADFDLSRDSSIVTTYIEANGIKKISTTPGTGYYANEKDESTFKRVGLPTSPLYDATSTTYQGDFKIKSEYGVELNSYYEETSYSRTNYYFCDNYISFSPDDGECIYSGEYLFCFSYNGTLIGVEKITER